MKNIQAQYQDLLEGKTSKANFMRNIRMQFPQYVTPTTSFEDSVSILKGKRILSEAKKPIGVYGHNSNAEAEKSRGIDHLNYYQVYHGIQYELAKMPEITDATYIAARKKVVDNILKDPDAYKELQLANFKAVKEMDKDLEMKDVKPNNLVDKPNEMKVVKKDVGANTQDTLEKKEKKKSKTAKVPVMTQTPKKAKGIEQVMPTPGKEKVQSLKEHILDEMTKQNPSFEHFQVGARVKKKDNSVVGEITEWDGDTATIKTDEGQTLHVQGNVLTKADVPARKEELAKTGTADEWANPSLTEAKPDSPHSVKADHELDQSALKFLKNAYKNVPVDQIPEKHRKRLQDLEASIQSRKSKFDFLKEKLLKAVKETMFKKGSGPSSSTVVASTPTSQSALKQQGYQEIPNTKDVRSL